MVPVGNHYTKPGLIDEKHRYNMVKIAIQDEKELEVSDLELNSDKTLMPIEIFSVIEKLYKQDEIYFLLGADNLYKIKEELQNRYNYIVIKRKDFVIRQNFMNRKNIKIIENEFYAEVSSTQIREQIKKEKTLPIKGVPKGVEEYIKENGLYDC